MTDHPDFGPITIEVGSGRSSIALTLRQLDGIDRVQFSCRASEVAQAIERGQRHAQAFGFGALGLVDKNDQIESKVRRIFIEMALALEGCWVGVEGIESSGLWDGSLPSIVALLEKGDAALAVPPLVGSLGVWFTGPLLEIEAQGEF